MRVDVYEAPLALEDGSLRDGPIGSLEVRRELLDRRTYCIQQRLPWDRVLRPVPRLSKVRYADLMVEELWLALEAIDDPLGEPVYRRWKVLVVAPGDRAVVEGQPGFRAA